MYWRMHGRKPSRFATVEGEAKQLSVPGLHGSLSFHEWLHQRIEIPWNGKNVQKSEILQALRVD